MDQKINILMVQLKKRILKIIFKKSVFTEKKKNRFSPVNILNLALGYVH